MKIEDLTFTVEEILQRATPTQVRKMVDDKLMLYGYKKSISYAKEKTVSRAWISELVKKHPKKFDTINYGPYLYVREKNDKE